MSKIFANSARKDTTTKKNGLNIKLGHTVSAKKYSFASPGVVAAGEYSSTIAEVKLAKTRAGQDAVDLLYDLTNSAGHTYHVMMRYPRCSVYFGELVDALLAAGLSEDDDISDAVGVKEKVVLEYVNDGSIGSITSRTPIGKRVFKSKAADEDAGNEGDGDAADEFDEDLLSLDDEEYEDF